MEVSGQVDPPQLRGLSRHRQCLDLLPSPTLGAIASWCMWPACRYTCTISQRLDLCRSEREIHFQYTAGQRYGFRINGSIAMPIGLGSVKTLAAVFQATNQLDPRYGRPNQTVAPWSTTTLAFESSDWPEGQSFKNSFITAKSKAFSASLLCEPIEYTSNQQDQNINSTITWKVTAPTAYFPSPKK